MQHIDIEVPQLPRHMMVLKQRDKSCSPDAAFTQRIAFRRKPFEEDLAILDAWQFRFVQHKARA